MPEPVKAKTYVISLKGSDKRRASIKEQFDKFHITYEIVDAVRGTELDIPNDVRIDQDAVRNTPHWLTPGAIGCALSHLECFRRAREEGLDYVVIFEDDAKILSDYTRYLDKIFVSMRDRDVVLLYHTAFGALSLDSKTSVRLDDGTAMYHILEGLPISATAYILSRKGYMSLLENIIPIRVAIDKWEYFAGQNILDGIVCVYPNPVDTMDFKSDIVYLKSGWKKTVSELIDSTQIFPFYQILKGIRRRAKLKMKRTTIV